MDPLLHTQGDHAMQKTEAGVVMPNLNQDEAVEKFSTTAGAYVGAGVTALISGLCTAGLGLFRGAVAGAQNTFKNGQVDPTPAPVNQQDEIAALRARLAQLEQPQA
jgi:hypothetical protein